MDRSFLSSADVVSASRKFVCIRVLSYENQREMDYLKGFMATRSGEAENTLVCIMTPDAKRRLIRAARSTRALFRDAHDMAETLNRIAQSVVKEQPAAALPLADLPEV